MINAVAAFRQPSPLSKRPQCCEKRTGSFRSQTVDGGR